MIKVNIIFVDTKRRIHGLYDSDNQVIPPVSVTFPTSKARYMKLPVLTLIILQ